MSKDVIDGLLEGARNALSEARFEDALKSANAVLALQDENEEATSIAEASKAAIKTSGSDRSTEQEDLNQLVAEVQKAINGRRTRDAQTLVFRFLKKYPEHEEATKILNQIRELESRNVGIIRQQEEHRNRGDVPPRRTESSSDWLTLFLFCLFLGGVGAHRFYVGKHKSGIVMFVTLGFLGIWTLIDFIWIIFNSFTDSEDLPVRR